MIIIHVWVFFLNNWVQESSKLAYNYHFGGCKCSPNSLCSLQYNWNIVSNIKCCTPAAQFLSDVRKLHGELSVGPADRNLTLSHTHAVFSCSRGAQSHTVYLTAPVNSYSFSISFSSLVAFWSNWRVKIRRFTILDFLWNKIFFNCNL